MNKTRRRYLRAKAASEHAHVAVLAWQAKLNAADAEHQRLSRAEEATRHAEAGAMERHAAQRAVWQRQEHLRAQDARARELHEQWEAAQREARQAFEAYYAADAD